MFDESAIAIDRSLSMLIQFALRHDARVCLAVSVQRLQDKETVLLFTIYLVPDGRAVMMQKDQIIQGDGTTYRRRLIQRASEFGRKTVGP